MSHHRCHRHHHLIKLHHRFPLGLLNFAFFHCRFVQSWEIEMVIVSFPDQPKGLLKLLCRRREKCEENSYRYGLNQSFFCPENKDSQLK